MELFITFCRQGSMGATPPPRPKFVKKQKIRAKIDSNSGKSWFHLGRSKSLLATGLYLIYVLGLRKRGHTTHDLNARRIKFGQFLKGYSGKSIWTPSLPQKMYELRLCLTIFNRKNLLQVIIKIGDVRDMDCTTFK